MFIEPAQSVVESFHVSLYSVPLTNPLPITLTVAPTVPLTEETVTEGVVEKLALA